MTKKARSPRTLKEQEELQQLINELMQRDTYPQFPEDKKKKKK